jgi:hypothetical protein
MSSACQRYAGESRLLRASPFRKRADWPEQPRRIEFRPQTVVQSSLSVDQLSERSAGTRIRPSLIMGKRGSPDQEEHSSEEQQKSLKTVANRPQTRSIRKFVAYDTLDLTFEHAARRRSDGCTVRPSLRRRDFRSMHDQGGRDNSSIHERPKVVESPTLKVSACRS